MLPVLPVTRRFDGLPAAGGAAVVGVGVGVDSVVEVPPRVVDSSGVVTPAPRIEYT